MYVVKHSTSVSYAYRVFSSPSFFTHAHTHTHTHTQPKMPSFSYSSHRVDPAALKPLLTILAEDTRALRAKTLALRNTAAKGFKNYNITLHQVGSKTGFYVSRI